MNNQKILNEVNELLEMISDRINEELISEWDYEFLESIQDKLENDIDYELSEKQINAYERIYRKYMRLEGRYKYKRFN